MKNKKIVITVAIIILILAVIIGIIIFVNNKNSKEEVSKTTQIYEEINEAIDMVFIRKVDDDNKITTFLKGDKAYKEIVRNGKVTKYIVKDGNTYLIDDSSKKYYEYQNNTTVLSEVKLELEKLKETSNETGKEKINGKTYDYEEFNEYQSFLVDSSLISNNNKNSKTRFYYNNDKLVYIKTIIGDKEEIAEVELKYSNINDEYFNIPENYIKQ